MGNELTSWAAEQLDRIIIGRAWGLVALGQYTVSSSLARAPVGMLMASVRALTFAGTARAQEDRTAVAAALLLMIEAAVLITVPMFVIVSLEAEVVLVLVYGPAWREAAPLLAALAVAVPPLVVSTLVSSVLRGIGAVGLELRVLLVTSALFLLCLAALSSGPLAVAVWCAPVALVLRTAWLTVVVSGRLDLPMSRVLGALRGAGVLAVWAAGCCLAVRTFAAGPVQTSPVLPLLAGLVSLALALVAANRLCMSTQLRELIGRECAGRIQRMRGARAAAIHSAARDAS
jgi:PST family polysaccharide transporter